MPSDDGVRLHDGQATGPVLPAPGQQHPEEPIALFQAGAPDSALEDGNLLPQGEILKGQLAVGRQDGDQGSV